MSLVARPVTISFTNPAMEKHLAEQGSLESYIISDLVHIAAMKGVKCKYVPQMAQLAVNPTNSDQISFAMQCKEKERYSLYEGMKDRLKDIRVFGMNYHDYKWARKQLGEYMDKMKDRSEKARGFMDYFTAEKEKISFEDVNKWAKTNLNSEHIRMRPKPNFRFMSASSETYYHPVVEDEGYLQVTEDQKEAIYVIIKTMGTKGLFGLLKQKSKLQRLGETINNVPPLQFLAVIFSNPELKSYMPKIADSSFKWGNLIGGVKKTLNKEWSEGIAQEQIPAFATFLGLDPEPMRERLDRGDVDSFVKSLF